MKSNNPFCFARLSLWMLLPILYMIGSSVRIARGQTNGQTIRVDFGGREYRQYPIPSNWLGLNDAFGWGAAEPTAVADLQTAGYRVVRGGVYMPDVFPLPGQTNFQSLQTLMANYHASGFAPLIDIAYTPFWLQSGVNYCASGVDQHHNPPSPAGYTLYGELAAQVVHYLDTNYPGIVSAYEIWNEPDSPQYLCAPTSGLRQNFYLNIFGAAAQAMYQQWRQDDAAYFQQAGRHLPAIQIGGPVLANVYADENSGQDWIAPFLGDNSIYTSYDTTNHKVTDDISFFDFHDYITGALMADNEDWNGENGAEWHLLQMTQGTQAINPPIPGPSYDPSPAQVYEQISTGIEQAVQQGYLPHKVPIYLTEYNASGGSTSTDAVRYRQSSPYGYVWNALFITDLLNSVYRGAIAPPAQLDYFAGRFSPQGKDQLCLLDSDPAGNQYRCVFDGHMVAPLPQYYFYDLLGNPNYLGLESGGTFMAKSVQTDPTLAQNQVVATGMTTPNSDIILIVNNSTLDYTSAAAGPITLRLEDSGWKPPTSAILYQVNSDSISATRVKVLPHGEDELRVKVAVPALSVIAVSVQGRNE